MYNHSCLHVLIHFVRIGYAEEKEDIAGWNVLHRRPHTLHRINRRASLALKFLYIQHSPLSWKLGQAVLCSGPTAIHQRHLVQADHHVKPRLILPAR
jgi:hypothetical protein